MSHKPSKNKMTYGRRASIRPRCYRMLPPGQYAATYYSLPYFAAGIITTWHGAVDMMTRQPHTYLSIKGGAVLCFEPSFFFAVHLECFLMSASECCWDTWAKANIILVYENICIYICVCVHTQIYIYILIDWYLYIYLKICHYIRIVWTFLYTDTRPKYIKLTVVALAPFTAHASALKQKLLEYTTCYFFNPGNHQKAIPSCTLDAGSWDF